MSRHLFVVIVALTACDRQDTPETAAARQQLADAKASCVKLFTRQRACTDTYIPALVDVRRELNKPHGIADGNRAETIAAALEEWKSDSTDEAISATCDHLAPQLVGPAVATSETCLGKQACGEFVTCVMPMVREHLNR